MTGKLTEPPGRLDPVWSYEATSGFYDEVLGSGTQPRPHWRALSESLSAMGHQGLTRRWREGPAVEPAIWAENIPFNETRDYVKKVLSNAAVYSTLLSGGRTLSLKTWLGTSTIGPREASAPAVDADLP